MPTVAELDVQIDATNKASDELARVDAQIRRLDGQDVDVDIDADGDQAEREFRKVLAAIRAAAKAGAQVPIGLDDEATRELAALQARLRALSQEKHTIEVEIEMERLRDQIRNETARIKVEADTAAARAKLIQLDAFADSIEGMIKMGVNDTIVRAKIAALKREINRLDSNINLDMDTSGLHEKLTTLEGDLDRAARAAGRLGDEGRRGGGGLEEISLAAERAGSNVRGLIAAGLALWPAIIPMAGAATAAVGGFGLAATMAGIGTGLFAAVAVTNYNDVTEAINKIETAQRAADVAITDTARENALKRVAAEYANLTTEQAGAVRELMAFKSEWRDFAGQFEPQVFNIAANGLSLLREIFPQLAPMVEGVGSAFDTLINKARGALQGPFWQGFIDMLNDGAGPAVETLGTGLGNLFEGLMGMFSAFFPYQDAWNNGFIGMTEKFREWGTSLGESQGFKDFMAYAADAIPRVNSFLGSLLDALVAIVRAVRPYGDVVLSALTGVLDVITFIGEKAPALLMIGAALSGLVAGFIALLGPITSVLRVAKLLFRVFANPGASFGRFLLIGSGVGAALLAIGAGLIYAYNEFDSFREAVNGAASAVKEGLLGALNWLQSEFEPGIAAVSQFLSEEWAKWVGFAQGIAPDLRAAWDDIRGDLEQAGVLIIGAADAIWEGIKASAGRVWELIQPVVTGGMEMIRGAITAVLGLITTDWDLFWSGLSAIAGGLWTILSGVLTGMWTNLQASFTAGVEKAKEIWSTGWSSLSTKAEEVWNTTILPWLQSLPEKITTGVGDLLTTLQTKGTELMTGFWTGVTTKWDEFVVWVQSLPTIIPEMIGDTLTWLHDKGFDLAQGLMDGVLAKFEEIIVWFTDLPTKVQELMGDTLVWLRTDGDDLGQGLLDGIEDAYLRIVAWFEALPGKIETFVADTLTWINDNGEDLITGFVNGIANNLPLITAIILSIPALILLALVAIPTLLIAMGVALIVGFAKGISSAAVDFLAPAVARVVADVGVWFLQAKGTVETALNQVVAAIRAFGGRFAEAGRSLISSMTAGISEMIGPMVNAIAGGVRRAVAYLPGSPAEKGPLSGSGYSLYRGQALIEDFAEGMRRRAGEVAMQARDIADLATLNASSDVAFGKIATGSFSGSRNAGGSINLAPGAVTLTVQVGEGVSAAEARTAFDGAGEDLAEKLALALRRE